MRIDRKTLTAFLVFAAGYWTYSLIDQHLIAKKPFDGESVKQLLIFAGMTFVTVCCVEVFLRLFGRKP